MKKEVNYERLYLAQNGAIEEKEPSMFQVVLHNDDFTPMEFVVDILEQFFYLDRREAIDVMLAAHLYGKARLGVYSREVAEAKVLQIIDYARVHRYPLNCSTEAA